ncbi:MAG TPA: type II CAAX endopeptidase family protein [Thermoanaerobaculia bacterium]|jgi:membrane protease YdiL (CAAX protease family)
MTPYLLSLTFIAVIWIAMIVLNERRGLFSCDRFGSPAAKWFAYLWLGAFMFLLATLVTSAALAPATSAQLAQTPFYSVFALHAILIIFLAGWWLASGRPSMREFFNIRHENGLEVAAVGTSVGVGAWMIMIVVALSAGLILQAAGAIPANPEPPAMINWMVALPIWKKALIVLSAMTVEEAFFRSFLQKRVGLIASTILFSLAHFTYGQPLLLIGITVVSLIIGYTFYRTKNVLPGVIAHGVFDAIQIFVIAPIALRLAGAGA